MVCRKLAKRYENLTLIPNQQTIFSTKVHFRNTFMILKLQLMFFFLVHRVEYDVLCFCVAAQIHIHWLFFFLEREQGALPGAKLRGPGPVSHVFTLLVPAFLPGA